MKRESPAPARAHLARLDVLRALAAIGVVVFHNYAMTFNTGWLPWKGMWPDLSKAPGALYLACYPLVLGTLGVPLFFVLSGFVIHLSTLKAQSFSVRSFCLRRFWRIYPPYLVAMLVSLAVVARYLTPRQLVLQTLAHAAFVHNLHPSSFFGLNVAFWSLGVEIQLYLMYPLVLLLRRRVGMSRALLVTGCVTLAARLISMPLAFHESGWSDVVRVGPLGTWFDWTLGAWLAERYAAGAAPVRVTPAAAAGLAGLLALSCTYLPAALLCQFTVAALISAVLIERAVRNRRPLSRPEAALAACGVWSYSLYLIHQPILLAGRSLLRHVGAPWAPVMQLAVYGALLLAVSIAASWLMYLTVETWAVARGKKVAAAGVGGPAHAVVEVAVARPASEPVAPG